MKICLVGVRGDALLGKTTGGSEKQIALLAQHFARRGNGVTLVASDHAGPDVHVAGVTLRAAWNPDKGLRWLRAPLYRFPNLTRVLRDIHADLYYVRGAAPFSPIVTRVGRALDSPVLLGLASDRDLHPDSGQVILGLGTSWSNQALAYLAWLGLQRRALRRADVVVAQNNEQAALCAEMGLPHVLIPSIVEEPAPGLVPLSPEYDVIWAGHVDKDARRSKGVASLVQLATALPASRFAVIGTLTAPKVQVDVARLEALSNVELLGPLSYGDTQRYIAGSKVVINTSPAEGFSNVVLEGWALGKPTVTLAVNPSGLLGEDGLGRCAGGDIRVMSDLLLATLEDQEWMKTTGERARRYVRAVHSPDAVCSRYEQLAVPLA